MKVLITGATGFIGSNLVFKLLENGHEVGILKKEKSELKRLKEIEYKIKIYKSDFYDDINNGIKEFMPEVIIHMATLFIYKPIGNQAADIIDSNIKFGTNILTAMDENGISYFLNIGTRWQHINNERYNPANLYAATKEAFNDILVYYGKCGIKYKTIELSDTFGEGDTRSKVFNLLINACKENKVLNLSPGEQIMDFLYVKDVCQYIESKMCDKKYYDNGNESLTGAVTSLHELGNMIADIYSKHNLFNWGGIGYRPNEIMEMPYYYKKIQMDKEALHRYILRLK